MRSIYKLANASSNVPVLATILLQTLFVSLKQDALAFLAGIWATGEKEDFKESRPVALLHAAAFLEAHILEDDGTDFQTILPTLFVALQNPDQQVCQGALECISRIRILASRKLSSVYRFDVIYGRSDSEYLNDFFFLLLIDLNPGPCQERCNTWIKKISKDTSMLLSNIVTTSRTMHLTSRFSRKNTSPERNLIKKKTPSKLNLPF